MKYSCKAILLENHNQKNNLEHALMYNRTNHYLNEDENYHLKPIGMTHIMNRFTIPDNELSAMNTASRSAAYGSRLVKEASMEILGESLYYIPTNQLTNKELYEYDLYHNIKSILKTLDTVADIIYIDTTNRNNLSTKVILEEADLVVVNLVQNSSIIQHFFDNYSSIISKCVFLVSGYHKQSVLNLNIISKLHSINKNQIAIIPYNYEYQEAVNQGTIIEFLSRNYSCKRKNPNYEFVFQVKKAVEMIMKHINYVNHQEAFS
jgi:hypothetical protein